MFWVVIRYSSHVFICTSTDSNNCLCTWLTVYIEIAITAVCKLLPWQHEIVQIPLEQLCFHGNGSYFSAITYSC